MPMSRIRCGWTSWSGQSSESLGLANADQKPAINGTQDLLPVLVEIPAPVMTTMFLLVRNCSLKRLRRSLRSEGLGADSCWEQSGSLALGISGGQIKEGSCIGCVKSCVGSLPESRRFHKV